jgi:hypothetical protein
MKMKTLQKGTMAAAVLLLAGCTSGGNPFSNPFGSSAGARVGGQPQQQLPVVPAQPTAAAGGRPSMVINASPKRVQETIVARAQRRGTTVVGANQTGVTLEIPLKASSPVVVQQCGEHRDNRTLRVYLETLPNGPGTTVSEDRYVIDGGASSCQLSLTQVDVDEANKSLADLKQQSESPRTASAAGGAPRPADPPGGVAPVNPGRPVVPIR